MSTKKRKASTDTKSSPLSIGPGSGRSITKGSSTVTPTGSGRGSSFKSKMKRLITASKKLSTVNVTIFSGHNTEQKTNKTLTHYSSPNTVILGKSGNKTYAKLDPNKTPPPARTSELATAPNEQISKVLTSPDKDKVNLSKESVKKPTPEKTQPEKTLEKPALALEKLLDKPLDKLLDEEKKKGEEGKSLLQTDLSNYSDDNRYRWAQAILEPNAVKKASKEFSAYVKRLSKDVTVPCDAYMAHIPKNRFTTIMCMDSTRVVLKERSEKDDYIHANWITLSDGYRYICTQGPLEETIEDFWHMVYTEKSRVVVMLCCFQENGDDKCAIYCSPKREMQFGTYTVRKADVKADTDLSDISYVVYELIKNGGEPVLIHHFSSMKWDDHSSPSDAKPIVGLLKQARELAKDSPITVHCSAGVGRSGAFVGTEMARLKIAADHKADMLDVIKELRTMRLLAVQSPIQFAFMHIALLETYVQDGVISRDEKLTATLEEYSVIQKKYALKLQRKREKKNATVSEEIVSKNSEKPNKKNESISKRKKKEKE